MKKKTSEINIPSKEELKEIMQNPGKIKGAGFRGDIAYVLSKKGETGLKEIEEETVRLGFPIRHKEIKDTDWYPLGLKMISLSVILTTFNWGKKELAEIAESSTKVSFIVRLFMRHFISPEKVFKIATPRLWKRYFSVGSIEAVDFYNVEKKGGGGQGILRIKNFKLHPLYCFYLGHFFIGIGKLTEPKFKELTFEETKCMFKGDDYHEYLMKWTYW